MDHWNTALRQTLPPQSQAGREQADRSPAGRKLECGIPRVLRRCIVVLLALACLSVGPAAYAQTPLAKATVTLTVDYGDGFQKRFTAVPWRAEMTVLDMMKHAEKHARGIRMTYRGTGSTALLLQIDDLKNEGRGRNWIYRVNGALADRSFGIRKLKANDVVLWRFEKYAAGSR